MNTIQDIQEAFGEGEVAHLHTRMQYMEPSVRQEFIDACIKYNTRPGAGWNGGHFKDPFTPVRALS